MIGRRPWRRPGRQEETESLIILIIGAGGLVGAIMRYLVGSWVIGAVGNPSFPYGTLVVNVLGCAMIGLLAGLAETRDLLSPEARAFLLVLSGCSGDSRPSRGIHDLLGLRLRDDIVGS